MGFHLRVSRDLEHTVVVRPGYRHERERIQVHVLACWLVRLLIRVIENETRDTWGNPKQDSWALMAASTAASTASSPEPAP